MKLLILAICYSIAALISAEDGYYNPELFMKNDESLESPSKNFRLTMQIDGNLVLYRQSDRKALWASNTASPVKFCLFQSDGNLVLYTTNHQPRWSSNTFGRNYLRVQDDGNVVIYRWLFATPLWSTGTNGYMTEATNLRTGSLNSTSDMNIGAMTMQEAPSNNSVGIIHFDHDPTSAGGVAVGALDQASNRTLDGTN
jgi:hypothetical protein